MLDASKYLPTVLLSMIYRKNPSFQNVAHFCPPGVGFVVQSGILSMFSPAVLDHFKNPRNSGDLLDATRDRRGDKSRLRRHPASGGEDRGWRGGRRRFKTQGCVTAIACSSYVAEWLEGKSAGGSPQNYVRQISEALGGLPQATMHGAQLAHDGRLTSQQNSASRSAL